MLIKADRESVGVLTADIAIALKTINRESHSIANYFLWLLRSDMQSIRNQMTEWLWHFSIIDRLSEFLFRGSIDSDCDCWASVYIPLFS